MEKCSISFHYVPFSEPVPLGCDFYKRLFGFSILGETGRLEGTGAWVFISLPSGQLGSGKFLLRTC